jgi:hypothetical protein
VEVLVRSEEFCLREAQRIVPTLVKDVHGHVIYGLTVNIRDFGGWGAGEGGNLISSIERT